MFQLDEPAARRWLEGIADMVEAVEDVEPVIGHDWDPRDVGEEGAIYDLVYYACQQKMIACPAGMKVNFLYVADEDGGGYVFVTVIEQPSPTWLGALKIQSYWQEMRRISSGDTVGVQAAMDVLQEAVNLANRNLRVLQQYVTTMPVMDLFICRGIPCSYEPGQEIGRSVFHFWAIAINIAYSKAERERRRYSVRLRDGHWVVAPADSSNAISHRTAVIPLSRAEDVKRKHALRERLVANLNAQSPKRRR